MQVLHDPLGINVSPLLFSGTPQNRAHESRLKAASAVSQLSLAIGDPKATKLIPLTPTSSVAQIQGTTFLEDHVPGAIST